MLVARLAQYLCILVACDFKANYFGTGLKRCRKLSKTVEVMLQLLKAQ